MDERFYISTGVLVMNVEKRSVDICTGIPVFRLRDRRVHGLLHLWSVGMEDRSRESVGCPQERVGHVTEKKKKSKNTNDNHESEEFHRESRITPSRQVTKTHVLPTLYGRPLLCTQSILYSISRQPIFKLQLLNYISFTYGNLFLRLFYLNA